ncbi:hypothetical protein WBP07_09115 [Novosphingobium sp. BL-8A]|uniref:tetratricopeptide repeat protein n=1 Tax=Novosphingobium sp. BL-8A TaxID=3127639 RepID=UPI003758196D
MMDRAGRETGTQAGTGIARRRRKWGALAWTALSICLAAPASAQPSARDRPHTGSSDIVVKAPGEAPAQEKADWKRAETDHVTVFSTGGEDELRRVASDLEQLHRLMARLYLQGSSEGKALKMQVILMDSRDSFQAMGLRDLRSQEGPFPRPFAQQHYYDPRESGDVLVIARSDQTIDLNTSRRFSSDCDALSAEGADFCTTAPRQLPLIRPWEAILAGAFAQHFMVTYLPAAYPRWYLDGIGALFSSVDIKRSGAIDYAAPPAGYRDVYKSYGYPQITDILTGRYLGEADGAQGWSPYTAWLMTHFFVFSKTKGERYDQFQRYMAAIRRGTPPAEAAANFGDMPALQREIVGYAGHDVAYSHAKAPDTPPPAPVVTALSPAAAALVTARAELDSRLSSFASGDEAGGQETGRDRWLARLHELTERYPTDADAQLFAAEAECRSGRIAECLGSAERVLSSAPDDASALTWKGIALADQAIVGPASARPARLAEARKTIERAIALDSQAPLPAIAYFESFVGANEPVPESAMQAMALAIQRVPAAPAPRLDLGRELIREGEQELAREVLAPVLYGAYDSPERKAAQTLFATAPANAAHPSTSAP